MTKKIFKFSLISLLLALTLSLSVVPALAEEITAEAKTGVNFLGTLIEIGSTDVPTTMIIRDANNVDQTVSITSATVLGQRRDQVTKLEDWIPGDQIRVVGYKNENTGVIDATVLVNKSIVVWSHRGVNGWIQSIDTANSQITVTRGAAVYTLKITDRTNIVIPGKGKVTINELQVNDRIRGRVLKRAGTTTLEAKIIVVLRRGNLIFQKLRNNVFNAELLEITSTTVPTTIKVKILESPTLRAGDVNNLIGLPGEEKTINVTENTRLVRRYMGRTDLTEFLVGDKLMIVGRAGDDGTIEAKLIKDNNIFKTSSLGKAGVITSIDAANNKFQVEWLGKTITVAVTANTKIIKGENSAATINDLVVGDKIRGRGTYSTTTSTLTADTIVVVNSLPEATE